MGRGIETIIEAGKRRTFAAAVDWPGWCRNGPDEAAALEALHEYSTRYARAIEPARVAYKPPAAASGFTVVERLAGNATTDFGAPGVAGKVDARPFGGREATRQRSILEACWVAFDAVAKKHARSRLSTGPRGGGRSVTKIIAHVLEADVAYLHRLGGRYRIGGGRPASEMTKMRAVFLETLASRVRGETPPMGRRTAPLWTPRYTIRRSAWHALDHAWEIEDRAIT